MISEKNKKQRRVSWGYDHVIIVDETCFSSARQDVIDEFETEEDRRERRKAAHRANVAARMLQQEQQIQV